MMNSSFSPTSSPLNQSNQHSFCYKSTLRKNRTCKTTLNNSSSRDFVNRKIFHQPFFLSKLEDRKNISFIKNTMKTFYEQIQLNLTYSEKLKNIQFVLRNCKQFSEQFGYFYLTEPMLSFNHQKRQLECWIHPNPKSQKPLHPIKSPTETDAKKIFYFEIKQLFKRLFPTIPQPKGSSYVDLLINIKKLKKQVPQKIDRRNELNFLNFKSNPTIGSNVRSTFPEFTEKIVDVSSFSSKKMHETIMQKEQEGSGSQTPRQVNYEQKKFPKQTISTLIQSIKSSLNFNNATIEDWMKTQSKQKETIKSFIQSMKLDASNTQLLASKIMSEFESLLKSRESSKSTMLNTVAQEIETLLLS